MRKIIPFLFLIIITGCSKNETVAPQAHEQMMNVAYGSDPLQKMDIYLPSARSYDTTRLMVVVHGGAWIEGDKSEFDMHIPTIKERFPGYAIANINYRLASVGGNVFPTQENDMKAAIDYLMQKRGDYKISDKLVLLGASAGGHMALLQAYKYNSPKIRAVIDFFGPADMKALYDSTMNPTNKLGIAILVGGTPASNPSAYTQSSPVSFINAYTPPTIMIHGSADTIVLASQSVNLRNKLQAAGVQNQLLLYPNLGHDVWPTPIMNDAFNKIQSFVYSVQ